MAGERPVKGGAHRLRSNVWGDAQSAAHPQPDKEKSRPMGGFFLYLAERGGVSATQSPGTLATLDLAPEAPAQGVQGSVHDSSLVTKVQVYGRDAPTCR